MFLHLGGNTIVRTRDVIAILNTEKRDAARIGPSDLRRADKAAKAVGEEIKSIVITPEEVYLSPISSSTLKKRAEFLIRLD
ncbi:MAG: extracellular matrix regulator RemB [Patescibacteria group bacterium]